MKVILLENFKRLGSIGEIIEVKRGFAEIFWLQIKKLCMHQKKILAQVEKLKTELSKKDNEKN